MSTLSDCSDDVALDDAISLTSVSSTPVSESNPSPPQSLRLMSIPTSENENHTSSDTPLSAIPVDATHVLTLDQWRSKRDAIEDCLRGRGALEVGPTSHVTESLDLWHLRELSVSTGGLLDPSLRKRAWPLLTQAFKSTSGTTTDTPVEPVTPSTNDILLLQRDVRYTVWNVQEKYHEQHKEQQAVALDEAGSSMLRRVTFATVQRLPLSPAEADGTASKEMKDPSPTSVMALDATDPSGQTASSVSFAFDDASVAPTSVRPRARMAYRKTTAHEQKIVTNVVTSCLRMAPPESEAFEDDRFRYYTGLHDLTALIMINMESPSLSSLVLGKLASFHLRDAMRKDSSVLETALQLTFFPLLKKVDGVLHDFIVHQTRVVMPTFAVSWMANWFATDVTDLRAASRLVDFFVASHATAPLYCAVALLTLCRKQVLQCEPELSTLYALLRTLPLVMADSESFPSVPTTSLDDTYSAPTAAMAMVEQIIAAAITYMKQTPPATLIELIQQPPQSSVDTDVLLSRVGTVSMLNVQAVPAWCTVDTSLTEWSMLQRPTGGGDEVATSTTQPKRFVPYEQLYPLATVAAGFTQSHQVDIAGSARKQSAVWKGLVTAVALVVVALVAPHLLQELSEAGESALSTMMGLVRERAMVQDWPRLGQGSSDEMARTLFRPFQLSHQHNRLATRPTLSKGPIRTFGNALSRSSDNSVSLQRRILTGTHQLIRLPILVVGIPLAMLTSALDTAVYVARLVHEKMAQRKEQKGNRSFKSHDKANTNGFQSGAARMRQRMANVVEAAVWYLRGEPFHSPKSAPDQVKPVDVGALDWRL